MRHKDFEALGDATREGPSEGPVGAPGEAIAELTIDDLFVDCVRRFGDRRAVTCEGRSLTYAQLDRRVDALARLLIAEGIEIGDRVALWLEPSLAVVIAMLGALRAGAAYLPIDTGQPLPRVQALLDDSDAKILITDGRAGALSAFRGRVLELADEVEVEVADEVADEAALAPPAAPASRAGLPWVTADDCAYLVYTSGTTGRPKGVLIEHHSLVHYVTRLRARYGIDASHTAALLTSYAFDLGYTTLWTTLLSGGELHLISSALRSDLAALLRYLGHHRVSFLKVTPSLLGALVGSPVFEREGCAGLRLLVTGGEPVRAHDLERLYARCPDVLAVNHYGPTETTIGVTTQAIPRDQLAAFAGRPVIGRPLGDTRIYIVTPELQLAAAGTVGELLVGGPGVGRGYHQRPELTREKFIPDPFGPAGTLYRTGDLARWTAEGTLELLGRADRQLKIRGYRVEPAEIEQVVLRRFDVREAVVVEQRPGDGGPVLCLYYVAEAPLPTATLRAGLAEVLPEYMVPACSIQLVAIPRSANGKLDVARLPEPTRGLVEGPADAAVVAPASELERALVALWAAVLGGAAEELSVTRNFFELGGHSLLMIQLIAEIDEAFGVEVPVSVFFGEGTVRAVAELIERGRP